VEAVRDLTEVLRQINNSSALKEAKHSGLQGETHEQSKKDQEPISNFSRQLAPEKNPPGGMNKL
jgi:hypothetical protein